MPKLSLFAIQLVCKLLDFISPQLAGSFSFKLFYYPRTRSRIRPHEIELMRQAERRFIKVNGKRVVIYSLGSGPRVLLVHGHESRASHFAQIINKLLGNGYQAVTFDAPGHGDSDGKSTDILEYQAIIREVEQFYGSFACVIAHSVGVLCSFYAVKHGVESQKIIAINGVSQLSYLTDKAARTLGLSARTLRNLNAKMESMFTSIDNIWQAFSADCIDKPVGSEILIVHDINDAVVEYTQAEHLHSSHRLARPIVATQGLGHNKILNDATVIDTIVNFIKS